MRAPLLQSCVMLAMPVLGACSGPPASTAQSPVAPPAPATQPRSDAPIAEYVVAAFADSKGVLWFGTIGKGVARYDGEELTYLSPAGGAGDNVVASIVEDKHGDLWFAGHQGTGLCKYDGTTFTRLWEDETRVRADRQGNIWGSTNSKVFRSDGAGFTEFAVPLGERAATAYAIVPGRVSMELEDSRGNLWFRTDGHGVFRHDGTGFKQFSKRDGLCSNTVWSVVEDRRGHIWFSCIQASQPTMTGDGGVVRYDGETFTAFPEVKGLTGTDIYTLYPDRAGDLWIGATGLGVYRHDGATFTLFKDSERPDLNGGFGLQAMTQDQHGTLWFGFSGGLFRLAGERFVHVAWTGPWK